MAGPRRRTDVTIATPMRLPHAVQRDMAPDMLDVARRALAGIRALKSALPAAFNSNFSLDILLMLYVDSARGVAMPLDRLDGAIGAPATVAARWAVALASIGHVTLADGAARLTDAGRDAIEGALHDLVHGNGGIVTSH